MTRLCVNIDHVATLRQIRGTPYPAPLDAAVMCETAGADGITVHLREDRRHIQDSDVKILKKTIRTRLNLEMAVTQEMVSIAEKVSPHIVCFVPEKRKELTTEGGLDVQNHKRLITKAIERLNKKGILVSLFVDPDTEQIKAANEVGAQIVEIHTGRYCDAQGEKQKRELEKIVRAIAEAKKLNLSCNAGHGLNIDNIEPLARLAHIDEFNIGHSIICRALMVGLHEAVREMVSVLRKAV